MSGLAEWVEHNYDDLVTVAADRLAGSSMSRETVRPAVSAFYDGLITAARHGDMAALQAVLLDWVKARSVPTEDEDVGLASVFHALKSVTWEMLVADGEATVTDLLTDLDWIAEGAVEFLAASEREAVLGDLRRELERARMDQHRLARSKSDFIAIAAHELKTPLTLIEGYVNMLSSEFPAEQYGHVAVMLAGISNGTARLRDIISNMIDVSMIDLDLLSLHFQPVWIGQLVEAAVEGAERTAADRQLAIAITDFDDGGEPLLGDPERLYQAFGNVVQNAIKYTPDGGQVTIRARRIPGFVDVQVSDTGIGIDPENLERIFDKFSPVGDTALHSTGRTKFKGGGVGLGLAIARGIVEAHGGTIWAESAGCDEQTCPGSTFHIMIPTRVSLPDGSVMSKFYQSVREDAAEADHHTKREETDVAQSSQSPE
jgi:signal transduction histidine kinase